MAQTTSPASANSKDIPNDLHSILITMGRSLGTIAVYGAEHPSVRLIIDRVFEELQTALHNRKSIVIGTYDGKLTVDEEVVTVRDLPIRTLEKRLTAMKVSHLALTRGLTRNELKQLIAALGAPGEEHLKKTLSSSDLQHIEMEDVKYVALREGESKTGPGGEGGGTDSGSQEISKQQVSQIVAFLKGEAGANGTDDVKKMISDPERLGQMIMEAASIRQSAVSLHDGESMADIVIGCLRRTYDGLRKESEFRSAQGKINLNKAMMLLEKNVLDKIHAAFGAQHPEIDQRIFDAIREMEEEQRFEVLTAHYFDQRRKLDKAEERLIETIQQQGEEKAREQFGASDIPLKDWQKLMIKAGANVGNGPAIGGGLDMSALAMVLDKLEGLMQIESSDPAQVQTAVGVTRNGLTTYANRIEARIQELEGQVVLRDRYSVTVEDHAEHMDRDDIIMEVSHLTLALLQPLTVINASIESAMRHTNDKNRNEMLTLAYDSGKRMQQLTERMMKLVGYPTLK